MFKNYIKTALRNLVKEKHYTLINIVSLAIGIACFLFLLRLDQYTYNFDSFHEKADQIYRINDRIVTESGSEVDAAVTPWPWAEALANEYSEIESYVRFLGRSQTVNRGNDTFNYRVDYVDQNFFDVFSYPLKKGDPGKVLDRPNQVVLTPQTAKNLFGSEDPVGKFIQIDEENFEVTGLLEEIPMQSSIRFNILASSENITANNYSNYNNWKTHSIHTYLLLQEGADKSEIEANFTPFLRKNIDEDAASRYSPWLQPISTLYLGGSLFADHGSTLDKSYVYIFTTIAFLILLIACINFINISTARAAKRNVEIGIRKVIGAVKKQLVFQYLFEVLLLALISASLSLILVEWALPWFNQLADWSVEINYLENTFFVVAAILVVFFVTAVAGGYPAFYLTKFRPTDIFRERGSASGRSWLRTGLVVTQFALAIFLLMTSQVVNNQIQYLYNKDMGYSSENVMQIAMTDEIGQEDAESFSQELRRNTDVERVAMASNGPFSSGSVVQYNVEGSGWADGLLMNTFYVDDQFIPLLGLELLSGRNFNPQKASDSLSAFIINEATAEKFGWQPEKSVGKTITMPQDDEPDLRGEVIGVVNNFHFESLENTINPLIMRYRPERFDNLLIRTRASDLSAFNEYVTGRWDAFFPGMYFYYFYVESNLSGVYQTEEVIASMLSMLTYLTVFIACLGLLGLASYTTLQRTKEIGIRKVMGATVSEIVSMLSYDFMRYVFIALLVGIPLAWWAVNQWLQNFAYHTEVEITTVIITLVVTIGIALATVSWQSVRAALANPVESLRSE